jgi:hypothetical protein
MTVKTAFAVYNSEVSQSLPKSRRSTGNKGDGHDEERKKPQT